jgi:hypothetical protein
MANSRTDPTDEVIVAMAVKMRGQTNAVTRTPWITGSDSPAADGTVVGVSVPGRVVVVSDARFALPPEHAAAKRTKTIRQLALTFGFVVTTPV